MKRALLIGIDYEGTDYRLYGCKNDVALTRGTLAGRGYEIRELTNDATRRRILEEMAWVSEGNQSYFHYSGHGTISNDVQRIVPIDFEQNGQIPDTEIYNVMMSNAKRMFAVFDCCHSGTLGNLPYIYSNGRVRGQGGIGEIYSYSASHDDQASTAIRELSSDGRVYGVLTSTIVRLLREQPNVSYGGLLDGIKSEYSRLGVRQNPVLTSGIRFNPEWRVEI